jgi:hypothetical protein
MTLDDLRKLRAAAGRGEGGWGEPTVKMLDYTDACREYVNGLLGPEPVLPTGYLTASGVAIERLDELREERFRERTLTFPFGDRGGRMTLVFAEHRADGWPLCPGCGDDELYSQAVPATIETICGCYRCGTLSQTADAARSNGFGHSAASPSSPSGSSSSGSSPG